MQFKWISRKTLFPKKKYTRTNLIKWFTYDSKSKWYIFSVYSKLYKNWWNVKSFLRKDQFWRFKYKKFKFRTFFKGLHKKCFFTSFFFDSFNKKLNFDFLFFSHFAESINFSALRPIIGSISWQNRFKKLNFNLVFYTRFKNYYLASLFNKYVLAKRIYFYYGFNLRNVSSLVSSFVVINFYVLWKLYFISKGLNFVNKNLFYKFLLLSQKPKYVNYNLFGLKFKNVIFKSMLKRKWLPSCYKKSSNIFVSFRKKFILFFRLKAKKLFKLQMAQIGLALKSLVFRYTKTKIDLFCLSFPLVLKTASIVSIFFAARLQQNYRLGGLTRSVLKTLIRCSELRGVVLKCSGRFTRAQRAKRMTVSANIKRIRPLGTFTALVDYAFKVAYLRNGACGIKVWLLWQDPFLRSLFYIKRNKGKSLIKKLFKFFQFNDNANLIVRSWFYKKSLFYNQNITKGRNKNKKKKYYFLLKKYIKKKQLKYNKFFKTFISLQFFKCLRKKILRRKAGFRKLEIGFLSKNKKHSFSLKKNFIVKNFNRYNVIKNKINFKFWSYYFKWSLHYTRLILKLSKINISVPLRYTLQDSKFKKNKNIRLNWYLLNRRWNVDLIAAKQLLKILPC